MSAETQLIVRGLSVDFRTERGPLRVVHDVDLSVARGETLAIVGESGSGKSVTSLAIMRLTPPAPRARLAGEVLLRQRDGSFRDLLTLPEPQMRDVRGNAIAMIFQEPLTSLNPVRTIGDQVAEALVHHRGLSRRRALDRAVELLDLVGIPEPRRRLSSYPHQLSGGMRQRVMIAIALSCDPSILIADEPTTALDVTVQAQILELIRDLQAQTGMSVIFITHNLAVVSEIADRVLVMYAGRIVEEGTTAEVLLRPRMPYTMGLLASVPDLDLPAEGPKRLEPIPGRVPDPGRLPPGCAFQPRCRWGVPGRCDAALPALASLDDGHRARCVRVGEIA